MRIAGSEGFLGAKNLEAKYQKTAILMTPVRDCAKPPCCCCPALGAAATPPPPPPGPPSTAGVAIFFFPLCKSKRSAQRERDSLESLQEEALVLYIKSKDLFFIFFLIFLLRLPRHAENIKIINPAMYYAYATTNISYISSFFFLVSK